MTQTYDSPLTVPRLTGAWRVVPSASELGFVTHIMFGRIPVRGRYHGYDGELHIDSSGYASGVLRVHTETISTGIKKRDRHLRSADFFHVTAHPHARFELTGLTPDDGDRLRLIGILHIRNEEVPIDTPVLVSSLSDATLRLEADFEVDHRVMGFEFKRLPRIVRVQAALTLERVD